MTAVARICLKLWEGGTCNVRSAVSVEGDKVILVTNKWSELSV